MSEKKKAEASPELLRDLDYLLKRPASALPVEAARGAEPSEDDARDAARWRAVVEHATKLELRSPMGGRVKVGRADPAVPARKALTIAIDGIMADALIARRAPSPATTTGDQTPAEEQRG